MNTFKDIKNTFNKVYSPDTQSLSLDDLKSLLAAVRKLECQHNYTQYVQMIKDSETRLLSLITEKETLKYGWVNKFLWPFIASLAVALIVYWLLQ